jgi:hypothetical protein
MGADEEGMHERLQTHLRELRSLNREIAEMKPPTLGSFLTLCWREPDSNHRSRRERDGETMIVGRGVSLDGSRQLFWTEKCCGPTGHTALL